MPPAASEYVTRAELKPWMDEVVRKLEQLRHVFGLDGKSNAEVAAAWSQLQVLVAATPDLVRMAQENQAVKEELRRRGLQVDAEQFGEHYAQMQTLVTSAADLAEMANDHVREKRLSEARLLVRAATQEALAKQPGYRVRRRARELASATVDKLWWGLVAAAAWVAVTNAGPWVGSLLGAATHHAAHSHPLH